MGGGLSGGVGVVFDNHALGESAEQLDLRLRQRRPTAGHDVADAGASYGNGVHVALDEHGEILAAERVFGPIEVIKHVAFGIDRGLGRIEILRLVLAKRARAKGNDFGRLVRNGKRDAATEAVEQAPAQIARDQAGIDHRLFLIFRFEMAKQQVASAGRVADCEPRNRVAIKPAVFEVGARGFSFERAFELLDEVRLRFPVNFKKYPALLIFAALFGRTLFRAGKRDAAFLGNDPHGFGKWAFLHLHHKLEDVAALAAAETMVNLPGRMHVEGRRLFRVKRAKAAEILPGFFQLDVFAYDADDIRLLLDLLRE